MAAAAAALKLEYWRPTGTLVSSTGNALATLSSRLAGPPAANGWSATGLTGEGVPDEVGGAEGVGVLEAVGVLDGMGVADGIGVPVGEGVSEGVGSGIPRKPSPSNERREGDFTAFFRS